VVAVAVLVVPTVEPVVAVLVVLEVYLHRAYL